MGWGFAAPVFLLGAGLLLVPWLLHRRRRSPPPAIPFSSLLFVPVAQREVVERRRLQHWPLMLLRMLLLLLLATAFARPYLQEPQQAAEPIALSVQHAVVLDVSASMASQDYMEQAKAQAHNLVANLPDDQPVAVLFFDRQAQTVAPLFANADPEAGSKTRARQALEAAQPTWAATDYLSALQAAENLLLAQGPPHSRRIVHLISDFQQSGMPQPAGAWRLSASIELDLIPIGADPPANLAVTQLALDPDPSGQLKIRTQIKNWSSDSLEAQVQIIINDTVAVTQRTSLLLPGSAAQVAFALPWDGQSLAGYVQIAADALERDNRRYFAWNPSRRQPLLLIREKGGSQPYHQLFKAALPPGSDLPWELVIIDLDQLPSYIDNPTSAPPLIIATALDPIDQKLAAALADYLGAGGRLFLPLSPRAASADLNQFLGQKAGIRLLGPQSPAPDPAVQLAWIDLDHPVFRPFRSPRFNDFSPLRFYNYHSLQLADTTAVLARFATQSSDTVPAVVEAALGSGRILVWTAGIDLNWTNLARSPRFVPLLHETLNYLVKNQPAPTTYTVGDRANRPMQLHRATPPWQAHFSDSRQQQPMTLEPDTPLRLTAPGLFYWRQADAPAWYRIEAVNLAAGESDPSRIDPAEFALKLAEGPVWAPAETAAATSATSRREYGQVAAATLFAFLLLEHWGTARLTAKPNKEES